MYSEVWEKLWANMDTWDGIYNKIIFESIIPDVIPDEKKPLEPPILYEEYDEE